MNGMEGRILQLCMRGQEWKGIGSAVARHGRAGMVRYRRGGGWQRCSSSVKDAQSYVSCPDATA
jgi:hypothetical protein